MKEVSADEFFTWLFAQSIDIMPDHSAPEVTLWRVVKTRQIVGKSEPGWKNTGLEPKRYYLANVQSGGPSSC